MKIRSKRSKFLVLLLLLAIGCALLIVQKSHLSIVLVGDSIGYNILDYDDKNDIDPLADIRTLLIESSDIFLFNLEGVLIEKQYISDNCKRYPRQSNFRAPVTYARLMKIGQINVANLANNHILDCGSIGLTSTKKALLENSIYSVGAGLNSAEACEPLILETKNIRLAFLSYLLMNENLFSATSDKAGAATIEECNIENRIRNLRDKVDFIIVSLHVHMGGTWNESTTDRHIAVVNDLLTYGADIVVGHGPHVPQGIWVKDGKIAFLSLGNFMLKPDYQMPDRALNSMIAIIDIHKGGNWKITIHPIKLGQKGTPVLPNQSDSLAILSKISKLSQPFNTKLEIIHGLGVINVQRN